MVGADYNQLEDMVSALTTRDPNKLSVYIEGYDSHSLRTYYYNNKDLEGIVDTVESINTIKDKYPLLRYESKTCTFALTYQGTWLTLVNNNGLTHERAKEIETNYHIMYSVSDAWVQDKLQQASHVGYVTCAFGLRVRTPLLKQTILGNKNTPYEAKAESRTAGNALGQSYGQLNNRAAIELQQRILASPYALDIKPIAHIHDSQYFIIKDKLGLIEWFNRNLIECMEWQELPEIQHDIVKLGAEMSVHYPNWSYEIGIPNNSNKQQILKICREANEKI